MLTEARRWDPLDMAVVDQIRKFEVEQPLATAQQVQGSCQVLRMIQALLLNGSAQAIRTAPGKEHETPLFFLMHTVADDFRQAELNLRLGYVVPVAWALRDAIEAVALAALMWKAPKRARAYWNGAEFRPAQVRKDLQALGLWSGMVGSLWTTYTLLSRTTHPNVDRVAQVMDETKTEAGVVHTFNAGGTRDAHKLGVADGLAAGCSIDVLMLAEPIIDSYLPDDLQRIFATCVRDVARKAAVVLESRLAQRTDDSGRGEGSEYGQRLNSQMAEPMAIFERALSALEQSAAPRDVWPAARNTTQDVKTASVHTKR